jgi:hypothetical protein
MMRLYSGMTLKIGYGSRYLQYFGVGPGTETKLVHGFFQKIA